MCCRVGACCFITDLRLATLIVAVLCLVGNISVLAYTSFSIKATRLVLQYFMKNDASGEKDVILIRSYKVTLAILAMVLLTSISALFLDVVLFLGAFRRRRDMLHFWSYGHAVVSGVNVIYFWFVIVDHFAAGNILLGLVFLVAFILGAVVTVYFWVVVRSFDLKLQRASFSTVSAGCAPSVNSSYVPPSSRPRASWETGKPTAGTLQSPPPYSSEA